MRRKHRKNVGIIGLGIIGSRAAASLRAAGYNVFVWNRSPKPVPNFLGGAAEVAELCEIIQLFVSDAGALMAVLESISGQLTPEHIVLCSATVGPEATIEAAKLVQSRGAQFLDAPFTGSKLAAERQQLVYYVGGEEASYLRAKPVLEATSKAIVRMGGVGDAAIVKVVTNLVSAASVQVLSEALAIIKKAGLPAETLVNALEHNAARSGVMDLKLPKMIEGDYEPHFSLKHMFKDVQLGIQMANALDVDAPVTSVTAGVMFGGIQKGWAELDFSAVFRAYEGPAATGAPTKALPAPKRESSPAAVPLADDPPNAPEGEGTPPERRSHIFARIFSEDEANAAAAAKAEEPVDLPPVEEGKADAAAPSAKGDAPIAAGEPVPADQEVSRNS